MGADVGGGLKSADADRHRDAGSHVVAERDGAQKSRAINVELFAGGEGRRDNRSARMGFRRRVRIVRFVRMSQHRIGEGGFDCAADYIGRGNSRDLFGRMLARKIDREAAGCEIGCRRPWRRRYR